MKPFTPKNIDKIDLNATNPNLKKGSDRDFQAQPINFYVVLLDGKSHTAQIKFCR